jgi:dCMP deaminase
MERPSWDEMYTNMCYEVASRSPDESSHSGCFIANKDNTPVSFGYNGLPRGVELTSERQERPLKYQYFEHAERNAIYNAGREGKSCLGTKLYVNWLPCSDCARGIIQAGVAEVIVHKQGQEAFLMSRNDTVWTADHNIVTEMFGEASVRFRWYDGPIRPGLTGMWSGKTFVFPAHNHPPIEITKLTVSWSCP